MRYRSWILLLLLGAASLQSCGTIKKAFSKKRERIQTEATTTSTTNTTSTTVVEEKVDTTVSIPGDTLQGEISLPDSSQELIDTLQGEYQLIEIKYKPRQRKLQIKAVVKPRQAPVVIDRKSTTTTHSTAVEKREEKKIQDTLIKQKDIEKKGVVPWWVWILLILLLLISILLGYLRWQRKKFTL